MNKPMNGRKSPKNALELLDMYYLDMRSALLELAAGLDRVQAAQGGVEVMKDVRIHRLLEGCRLVGVEDGDRALRFQKSLSVGVDHACD